jgi:hypothetical protein
MFVASSVFFVSLTGIILLLSVRIWEERRARILFPRFRQLLDRGALACKELLVATEGMLVRLPSMTMSLLLRTLAASAMGFARFARSASESAHQLADFVSHKRNFERRETRSEFLKQVIEHKNGLVEPQKDKKRKTRREVDVEV